MSTRWFSYPDERAAAEACARHIQARLEEALSGRSYATLALSGGTTPRPLFEILAGTRFPWHQVHLFWVDERAAPPTDAASYYRMAAECFILPARIPARNVHRIQGELAPEVAARRYVQEIRHFFGLDPGEMPRFDVVHQGVGVDGHTASLFPGDPLLEDRENIAAAVYVQKLGQWRITLLPGVLLAPGHTVFLVTGADKADIVRAVFQEPYDPKRLPAQIASHHGRSVTWFLDREAARLLE